MTKLLNVLALSGVVAFTAIATPTPADARCRGCGIAAGIVAGAVIAGAVAGPRYYGPDYYAYDPGYAYADPYNGAYASYDYGYGYPSYGYRYRGITTDYTNADRQLQGTR